MAANHDMPLVTVVIPTYNRMPLIVEAVQSVIAQTYSNWELFVVDDGSTDETVDAIKYINDDRIHVIELKHEGIIGPLRNTGALAGKGEWISFLDSDDIWMPQKLELQIEALRQSGFECCYGNFELMDEKRNTILIKAGKFVALSGYIIKQVLTTEAAVTIGSLMLSRKLFNTVNGFSTDPFLRYRDDYDLVVKLANLTELVAVPNILLRVREYAGRGTNLMNLSEAHEISAVPYKKFIIVNKDIELHKIALKQYKYHMMLSVKKNLKLARFRRAFTQLKKIYTSKK